MIDTAIRLETPEGVALALRPAGPLVRGVAWLLDLAVRAALYFGLWMVLLRLPGLGTGAMLIAMFALEWLYPVLFEVLAHGRTPGKHVMGVLVVHDDGAPIGWTGSMIRNLLRVVDFFPLLNVTGFLATLAHRDFKRLGDLAAGTLVVYRDPEPEAPSLPEVPPAPPPRPLDAEEQRAMVEFAARAEALGEARAAEIADILEPMTGRTGETAVRRLQGIARWIAGAPATETRP